MDSRRVVDDLSVDTSIVDGLVVHEYSWPVVDRHSLSILTARQVKIALQLYKVKEKRYLLDIKKLNGETFLFFDVCSKLYNELEL